MHRVFVSSIRRSRSGFGLTDLLVVVALIPLLAVLVAGCVRRVRDGSSNPTKCASNLRQIGQAILLYSNENRGAYPRTKYVAGKPPTWGTHAPATQPFSDVAPDDNDVTAALFLLMRTQEITSEVFVCPSSSAERLDLTGGRGLSANDWSNWDGNEGVRLHLSYSYSNPYPAEGLEKPGHPFLTNSLSDDYAVAADINPGTWGGKNVLGVTPNSTANQMMQGNSRNHDGAGQNVLFGDGHVDFTQNPFVGVKKDNIYTAQSGKVIDAPQSLDDSVLLPTDEE